MRMGVKIAIVSVLISLFLWFFYWIDGNIFILFSNFDGLNYLIVAKSWYSHDFIRSQFDSPLPLEYYPAHWPLYPGLIALLDLFLPGPWAMLLASLMGMVFFYFTLVKFLRNLNLPKNKIFWVTLASLVLPARWLVVRSIGSPEAWFMGFVLMALLSYRNKKYFQAGVWGALAQLTKSPAILLFVSFAVYELIRLWQRKNGFRSAIKNLLPVSVIPLTVLLVFYFYYLRTGDFWAYFNSGDNFHLSLLPFSIFTDKAGVWVGSFWLEDVIYTWLIYGLGLLWFGRKNKFLSVEFVFAAVFFVTTLFVAHRDIARYILPVMPLALAGYQNVVIKREFKWLLGLLVLPVLLYAFNFMANNTVNISDWSPYL